MRAEPDELIEDLRRAAAISHQEMSKIPLTELIEWEAADFIEAVKPVLEQVAGQEGPVGEAAQQLLAGEFAVVPESRIEKYDFD
jgi:hypothetical protein